jgi:hypothetical protein
VRGGNGLFLELRGVYGADQVKSKASLVVVCGQFWVRKEEIRARGRKRYL